MFLLDTTFGCNFEVGDAAGGSERSVGQTNSREECAALVRSNEPSANGATYGTNGGRTCYAEFGATYIAARSAWQTCIFGS